MTGTNHRSIQPRQDKFDTNGVSIGIYNHCSVTMSYFKQDFVGTFKKVRRDINVFYGPKVHTIYEGTIDCDINYATGHPRRVEIRNSLYVTNGREQLTSTQHWAQNIISTNTDATTPDCTWCVTHHDCDTLIWCGGRFICNVPLCKQILFTI